MRTRLITTKSILLFGLCMIIINPCNLQNPNTMRRLVASCGDGSRDPEEECDDGGSASGDGCSFNCLVEIGFSCTGMNPDVCTLMCGNGVQDGVEECDDGDTNSGDGCSGCVVESGYECVGYPSTCNLICSNGSQDDSEQCDDGNIANGDGCDANCNTEPGYECSGFPSTCNLICGNGRQDSSEQCDDANNIDGDGCTPDCLIESDWHCSSTYPSVCSQEVCGNGKIESNETCDDGNTIDEDGCSKQCKTEQFYNCQGTPSICKIGVIEASESVQMVGSTMQSVLNAGVGIQLVIAVVLGQSLASMWILVNTIQLINYSAMMSLYFPKVIVTTYRHLGSMNFQSEVLSDIYMLHIDESKIENKSSWDYRFENQGVESTNILVNCSDTFCSVLLMVIFYLLIWLLSLCIETPSRSEKVEAAIYRSKEKNPTCCTRVKEHLKQRIRNISSSTTMLFNTFIRIIFEVFLDVCFASIYNIYDLQWQTYLDYYSNIVALFWLFIFAITLLSLPIIYFCTPSNRPKVHPRVKVLFEDFKPSSRFYMLDHVVFMLRRLLFVGTIIFGWNHGILQASILSVSSVGVLTWKIVVRPYKRAVVNFQEALFEASFTIISLIYLRFTKENDELSDSRSTHIFGIVCVILVFKMILINIIVTFSDYFSSAKESCSKRSVRDKLSHHPKITRYTCERQRAKHINQESHIRQENLSKISLKSRPNSKIILTKNLSSNPLQKMTRNNPSPGLNP
ncbi:unnamed protein product [Moneuplotes crassus]|uniref:Uncharacterized protein n=1 Tax=Euplotes crassus TaxID=5936 RepID=A0AAD1Y0B5_EUPCR|nr:unnamed protein product [Moneuplotes crassus]